MIYIKPNQGRLGNQMFEYAFAYMLSLKLGTIVRSPQINGLPHLMHVVTPEKEYPTEFDVTIHDSNVFDVLKNISRLRNKRILVNGHFESYEFVKDIRQQLFESFALDQIKLTAYPTGSNTLGIHVRLGDIREKTSNYKNQRPCPIDYYKNIIKNGYDTLYCLTDSPEDSTIKHLQESYPEMQLIHQESPVQDMAFLSRCDTIVMSQSTFSWWAAFLSKAKTIHFPIQGHWKPNSNLANNKYTLRMDNDPRVVHHELESDSPKVEFYHVSHARDIDVTTMVLCIVLVGFVAFFLLGKRKRYAGRKSLRNVSNFKFF